ncbi:nitroreductase family protein [Spiroplasma alleghenense]|uniref:Putative NAD(P)H nitroreductase n=1 Tax=Spiroplasma alleghenense TaxID=216931 RepID=A0A345Z482_9MOLU|nr:nitroreductase family protein [Spiroplasma alleghenense]AXK51411.1 putative NAD(P)H nitroreductase [Spiroplasma alleghenense]
MKNLDELLLDRKTIKKYNPKGKVSKEQLIEISNAGRMAPSGFGLQQVEILVVSNKQKKDLLAETFQGYNCENIKSASALIIVLGISTDTYILDNGKLMDEKLFDPSEMDIAKKEELKKHLLNIYPNIEFKSEYDMINAGIHVGYMALKATELNLGSTIMTGFFVDKLTIQLKEMGMLKEGRRPVFGFAIGEPDNEYPGNKRQKIRVGIEEYANFIE